MATDYDAIVIGSGFGGAVAACRLAVDRKQKVLLLERGRRWNHKKYPVPAKDWFWRAKKGAVEPGWFDIRGFGKMSTIAGAGVGGGSLHYANVSIPAPKDAFDAGWPPEVRHETLAPYYDKVTAMLTPAYTGTGHAGQPVKFAHRVPQSQGLPRTALLEQAAKASGFGTQFDRVDLAVNFDPTYTYLAANEPNEQDARQSSNPWGVEQGFCVHLGFCVLGCPVKARNVLEYNYIAYAESNAARTPLEVRPLHLVRTIERTDDAYRVHYDRIGEDGRLAPGSATAGIVVVSAGSVGSTELLLRCRDEYRTLPDLSPMLGRKWSSNTNYLTIARHAGQAIHPKHGPPITAAVAFFGAQKYNGQAVNIEDGGGPDLLRIFLRRLAGLGFLGKMVSLLFDPVSGDDLLKDHMPWFSQGRDELVGAFRLKGAGSRKALQLDWDPKGAEKTVEAIIELHERFARSTGGKPPWPFLWRLFRSLLTPHPLGGCPMGRDRADGVVDHKGAAFGYPGLYVADGSIVPRPIGLNPSKTIAALAERVVGLMP